MGSGERTWTGPWTYLGPLPEPPAQSLVRGGGVEAGAWVGGVAVPSWVVGGGGGDLAMTRVMADEGATQEPIRRDWEITVSAAKRAVGGSGSGRPDGTDRSAALADGGDWAWSSE